MEGLDLKPNCFLDEKILGRVEEHSWQRLEMWIWENSYQLGDVIFQNKYNVFLYKIE